MALLLPESTMESPNTITAVTRGPCDALYWYPWHLVVLDDDAAAAATTSSSSSRRRSAGAMLPSCGFTAI